MITLELDQSFIAKEIRLKDSLVQALQESIGVEFKERFDGRIGISYVSDEEIRRLNRMYRSKDTVTDVLSFSYIGQTTGESDQLGDIVISVDQAKRQSQDGDLELELADLIIHGILHVLGYDHEQAKDAKEMFPLQDRLVKNLL